MRGYDALFERPFPYVMAVHQAPTARRRTRPSGHLHVEFYPPLRTAEKLKYLAGSEQGAGTFISDTLPEESAAQLREAIVRAALSAARAFAPGRVNLIGEHTDYNQGLALPFAIAEGVTVRPTRGPRGRRLGERISAYARDLGEHDEFALAEPPPGRRGWRAFVRGVVAELAARRLPARRRAPGDQRRAARAAPACPPRRRSRSRCASR